MEIERKFTVKSMPENLEDYAFHEIEQGYLNTDPVIRIRREDDSYYFTYKGKGFMAREEYNLPLNKEAYYHLREKADGNIISKTRYLIPIERSSLSDELLSLLGNEKLTIELDVFHAPFEPLVIAEVEFPSIDAANAYQAPDWFLEDVSNDSAYHNSTLSKASIHHI